MQPPSGPEAEHRSARAIPVSLAVAEGKRIVKSSIELQDITVRGEVTQIKLDATRGHWYFTIGDAQVQGLAQVLPLVLQVPLPQPPFVVEWLLQRLDELCVGALEALSPSLSAQQVLVRPLAQEHH